MMFCDQLLYRWIVNVLSVVFTQRQPSNQSVKVVMCLLEAPHTTPAAVSAGQMFQSRRIVDRVLASAPLLKKHSALFLASPLQSLILPASLISLAQILISF